MAIGRSNSSEMRAADLLFTLDHPVKRNWQLTVNREQRSNSSQACRNLSLVVRRATSVKFPIAHRWLERRRMPQFKWLRWPAIVMIVEQHRVGAATTQLSIDHRRSALRQQSLRTEAGLAQQRLNQVGHLCHAPILCRYTRLATQPLKECLGIVYMFIQI